MTQVERDNAAEVLGNMLSDIADNKLYGIKRDEINAILRSIIVLRDYKPKPAQHEQVSPTTQLCPECKTPMPIEAQLTELCRLTNINIRVCDLLKTALALLAGGDAWENK